MLRTLNTIPSRSAFTIAAVVCAALLSFGFFLQYVIELNPCPLCLVQRGFFFGMMGVFIIGALHGPAGAGARVYGVLAFLFGLGGMATAARQVWLQHLPKDQVPECGPDLYYMMSNFPLTRTIYNLFRGSGECAVVDWTFLSLSIAEWSLIWFALLSAGSLWIAFRRYRPVRKSFA